MVRQDCLSRHEAGHLLASKLRPRLRPTCSDPKQPQRLSNLVELTPGPSQSGPQQGRMDGTSRTLSHEQWHGFNRWSESLSGNLPGARIGMVLRAPRRGKQVSRYQPEPGEYVAGQEGIALLEQNRLIRRCMNPHRALPGVDQPDPPCAGLEVLSQLSLHLGLGVALAQNLDGQVGARSGIGLPGRSRPGSLPQEVNAASEMST